MPWPPSSRAKPITTTTATTLPYKDFNDIITSPISDKAPLNADGTICTDPSKYNKSNTVWVGDLKFKDVNGDGRITEADKTNIGSPLPKFTFRPST